MELMNRINGQGGIYFTHTRLNGRIVLRLCIAQTNTMRRHVVRAMEILAAAAASAG